MGTYQPRVIDPKFRAVYNGTGSTISKGTIIKLKTSPAYSGEIVKAAAATDALYGVAAADILTGEWGDAQIGGVALVLSSAALNAATQMTSDASGKAAAAASGNSLLGISVTAAGAADELFEVELATPGGEAN
jgi:hypothetical protein